VQAHESPAAAGAKAAFERQPIEHRFSCAPPAPVLLAGLRSRAAPSPRAKAWRANLAECSYLLDYLPFVARRVRYPTANTCQYGRTAAPQHPQSTCW